MTIYWMLLFVTLFLVSINREKRLQLINVPSTELTETRYRFKSLLLVLVPFVFFCGMRSEFGDTTQYMITYDNCSTLSFKYLDTRCYGFSLLMQLCKTIGLSSQTWIMLLVVLSVIPVCINIADYSSDARISLFLFISSTEFTFLLNGARQFLAVSICFYALRYIIKRQPIKYYLFVLMAISVHVTAVVMIPIYFIANIKPWGKRMWLSVVLMTIICVFSTQFLDVADTALSQTAYGHYMASVKSDAGVNIIRTLIHFVPIILSIIYKDKIHKIDDPVMNTCVSLSLLNAMVFSFASITGGNLTGRMAEYFTIYNLILYPYLFTRCMTEKTKKWLGFLFVVFYLFFFYYQMDVTWNAYYVSKALDIVVK